MWYEANLVIMHYKPLKVEKGMVFVNYLYPNSRKSEVELWKVDKIPLDADSFIQQNGLPVRIVIIDDDNNKLAQGDEIGWWDEGEDSDEYRDADLKDINTILNDYEGFVDIKLDDDYNQEDILTPEIIQGKVILRIPQEDDDEEEDEEDIDNENE